MMPPSHSLQVYLALRSSHLCKRLVSCWLSVMIQWMSAGGTHSLIPPTLLITQTWMTSNKEGGWMTGWSMPYSYWWRGTSTCFQWVDFRTHSWLTTDKHLWGFVDLGSGWKVETNYIIAKGEAINVVCMIVIYLKVFHACMHVWTFELWIRM